MVLSQASKNSRYMSLKTQPHENFSRQINLNVKYFLSRFNTSSNQKADQLTSTAAAQEPCNSMIRIWEVHGSFKHDKCSKSCLYEAVLVQNADSSCTSRFSPTPIKWEKAISKPGQTIEGETLRERIAKKAIRLFLPHGYPDTVDTGYAQYASLCFCSNVAGSAAMVLSTQALLHAALGISIVNSSALSAGINWVIKDGVGQLGGILFASKIGRTKGLDTDPKKWRMLSAMAMDISTFMEICTPLFPGYFLLIASIANVGKNIGFLSASASKAALHQSLQSDSSHNLADLTAKSGSQAILASLVGTTVGIGLSTIIGSDFASVAAGFVVLSGIHEGCTYQALKAVRLRSFSRHRMHLLLDNFVHQRQINKKAVKDSVLSPEDVSKFESFFPLFTPDNSHKWLKIGCSLREISLDSRTIQQIMRIDEKYVMTMVPHGSSPFGHQIRLAFLDGATGKDLIRGKLHAYFARSLFPPERRTPCNEDDPWNVQGTSYSLMKDNFGEFFNSLQVKKWNVKDEFINIDDYAAYRLSIEMKLQEKLE
jgi:hypothetical protein